MRLKQGGAKKSKANDDDLVAAYCQGRFSNLKDKFGELQVQDLQYHTVESLERVAGRSASLVLPFLSETKLINRLKKEEGTF